MICVQQALSWCWTCLLFHPFVSFKDSEQSRIWVQRRVALWKTVWDVFQSALLGCLYFNAREWIWTLTMLNYRHDGVLVQLLRSFRQILMSFSVSERKWGIWFLIAQQLLQLLIVWEKEFTLSILSPDSASTFYSSRLLNGQMPCSYVDSFLWEALYM